jgi:hypothetical protein
MSSSFPTAMSSEPIEPDPTPTEPYIHPEDPDDEWAVASPAGRGFRVRAVTGVLVVLGLLAGGFWGGVVAEKHHGGTSTASSVASALASRFAALRGGTGTGTGTGSGASGFAGAAGATTGEVTEVQGNILYVTENDAAGTLVKVTVGPSTTVTRTAKSSLAGLQLGDTVIVTGSKAANGSVAATAIRATAQGVTTGGGGFAGLGAGGGLGSGGGFTGGSGSGGAGGSGGS